MFSQKSFESFRPSRNIKRVFEGNVSWDACRAILTICKHLLSSLCLTHACCSVDQGFVESGVLHTCLNNSCTLLPVLSLPLPCSAAFVPSWRCLRVESTSHLPLQHTHSLYSFNPFSSMFSRVALLVEVSVWNFKSFCSTGRLPVLVYSDFWFAQIESGLGF